MLAGRPLRVLLVDDSAADRLLTRACLEDAKVVIDLVEVDDGEAALEYLQRCDARDLPDLILLDLNMPRVSGIEVLEELEKDEQLKTIPVVVLTSSSADRDIVATYELGANCLVTKPVDLTQFEQIVRNIADFWFMVVRLPSGANPG